MHELSIAEALLALCRERLPAGERLATVHVAVGELASLEPELLRFAWQALVTGTPHADATLAIAWHAAEQRCADCGDVAERQPGSWLRLCPTCRSPLQVTGGDQLDLLRIETSPIANRALTETHVENAR